MTLIHSALMAPALLLSVTFLQSKPGSASLSAERYSSVQKLKMNAIDTAAANQTPNFVFIRKQRIQRMLGSLDSVAAATQQMKPEMAERIEPVIVDLAEQAIELATDQSLQAPGTDAALTKLEITVTELVHTMSRLVEPEASL